MSTNTLSTLQLLPWLLAGVGVFGLTLAVVAMLRLRRAKLAIALEQSRSSERERTYALAEAARQTLFEQVADLQRNLEIERQNANQLRTQLQGESGTPEAAMLRLPMPLQGTKARAELDWQAKLQQLEASLAQARRAQEASEQALKQAKLQAQRRQLEVSKLSSQVDDLALNLEETRILVTEKDRQILEHSRRCEQAESVVAHLREAERRALKEVERVRLTFGAQTEANARTGEELQQAQKELSARIEAHARTERMLQQARATIDQLDLNADQAAQQLEATTRQLEQQQAACATLERMLQEATLSDLQLRCELKQLGNDREQLETQNMELKYILDQLGAGLGSGSRREFSEDVLEPGTWPAMSELDVQNAVLGLKPIPSAKPPLTAAQSTEKAPERDSTDLERELRDTRLRLQLLESGKGDLDYLREQNAKLKDELLQDKGAARELTALQLDHKRVKLDLQLAEQRLASQAETIERLSHAASELQDHKEELEALRALRSQVRDLRAENFALQNANSGTFVATKSRQLQSDARALGATPLDTAVLSDHLGLPVAVTGNLPAESLAAVSGIAAQVATHVRELLPMGPISMVQWVDEYGMTVTCKLFQLAGDDMAMTALASGNPSEQTLRETLKQVLNSIGWTENGPQADLPDSAVG